MDNLTQAVINVFDLCFVVLWSANTGLLENAPDIMIRTVGPNLTLVHEVNTECTNVGGSDQKP